MGHDIIIRDGKHGSILENTGISYNWSSYSIYWHVDEARGKYGEDVATQLSKALDVLKKEGINPNDSTRVDGWGNPIPDTNGCISCCFEEYKKDRLIMFAKILTGFCKLAWEHPHGYWCTDQDNISTDGSSSDSSSDESEDSLEINIESALKEYPDYAITQDQLSNLVGLFGMKYGDKYIINYNFPDVGVAAVKNRRDVIKIIEHSINKDDQRAVSWTRLAFMLPK